MGTLNVILFLTGFLRTLFVIIIIYYVLKLVSQYILPMFIKQFNQPKDFQDGRQSKREGEVTIEGNRPHEGQIPKDEGEYIDFEEVD